MMTPALIPKSTPDPDLDLLIFICRQNNSVTNVTEYKAHHISENNYIYCRLIREFRIILKSKSTLHSSPSRTG